VSESSSLVRGPRGVMMHRNSSTFNIAPEQGPEDSGIMIDLSMLQQKENRRGSFKSPDPVEAAKAAAGEKGVRGPGAGAGSRSGHNKSGNALGGVRNRAGSVQSNGSSTGTGAPGAPTAAAGTQQQPQHQVPGLPTGASVPAAYYKETEEQLADALYKRAQAKLLADPDQANVESALADGLKVGEQPTTLIPYYCICLVFPLHDGALWLYLYYGHCFVLGWLTHGDLFRSLNRIFSIACCLYVYF
jgi:hypothetical protein